MIGLTAIYRKPSAISRFRFIGLISQIHNTSFSQRKAANNAVLVEIMFFSAVVFSAR
jgi:hypothetical protein